jgi:hypothetical protein
MKDFNGKIAVVTGGGTGMGRELVRQLVAEGCNVAMCDVSASNMAETIRLCQADRPPRGAKIIAHVADVSDEVQVRRFQSETARQLDTDKIHLLFNNAGIAGGGSFVSDPREQWERTFNVCWGGVYLNTRAFLPMLMNAEEGHIINTSSLNGFWAMTSPRIAQTAYSAAKFAVKGFSEALVTDLRLNAPHIKCSVVMPGHVGTSIGSNSRKVQSGVDSDALNPAEIDAARARMAAMGVNVAQMSDESIQAFMNEAARRFLEDAPMTAAVAATVILEGVKAERWRILVGDDARILDEKVRAAPERAYEADFFQSFAAEAGWRLGG